MDNAKTGFRYWMVSTIRGRVRVFVCVCVLSLYHKFGLRGVVAEQIRAPNSSSGVVVQQSVRLNPGRDTNVIEQDNYNCFSTSRGK